MARLDWPGDAALRSSGPLVLSSSLLRGNTSTHGTRRSSRPWGYQLCSDSVIDPVVASRPPWAASP
jgi:hypothetical protein